MYAQGYKRHLDARPVIRHDFTLSAEPADLRRDLVGCLDHRLGLRPRQERAVGSVAAVGEGLGRKGGASDTSRLLHGAARPSHQDQRARVAGHGADDGRGQLGIALSLVVERAVRLDVTQGDAFPGGDALQGRDLRTDELDDLRLLQRQRPAPEVLPIGIAGMRPHLDSVLPGGKDRAPHALLVSGVAPAGDAGRGQERDQLGVDGGVDLPHVGVQVEGAYQASLTSRIVR